MHKINQQQHPIMTGEPLPADKAPFPLRIPFSAFQDAPTYASAALLSAGHDFQSNPLRIFHS